MAVGPYPQFLRPSLATKKPVAVLSFLAPWLQCGCSAPVAPFSTSQRQCIRDNNRNRGLSAVRNTGVRPRQTLSVKHKNFARQRLPRPVPITIQPKGTEDHGLWEFFKDKKLLQTPLQASKHGRAWTLGELRSRDWDTLHQLWWVCVKERNRLATEKIERNRIGSLYGELEINERDEAVQETMKAILETLAERQLAYQEAFELAKQDPDIDIARTDGPQYTQPPYDLFEEDETDLSSYDAQPESAKNEIVQRESDGPAMEKPKDKVHYA